MLASQVVLALQLRAGPRGRCAPTSPQTTNLQMHTQLTS